MPFIPPCCPWSDCRARSDGETLFFQRWGHFDALRHDRPIPRYRCRRCRRTFSRQTFRYDYREVKPQLDEPLFRLLVSGVGLRQSGRILETTRRTVTRKFLRIAEQCRLFHERVGRGLDGRLHLQFDELETFEACRLSKPVTMGTLIEAGSRFVLEQANGAIRPSGRMSRRRRALIDRHEALEGPRRSESRVCVERVFRRGSRRLTSSAVVVLTTDRKTSYVALARKAFRSQLQAHHRVSGRLPRGPSSLLFPINHTNAMLRDNLSRLRRRSWLHSKKRAKLEAHAWIFVAYRNYIRPRFNGESRTPAQRLGLTGRRLGFPDILAWRKAGLESA